jgi:hypothetical protein
MGVTCLRCKHIIQTNSINGAVWFIMRCKHIIQTNSINGAVWFIMRCKHIFQKSTVQTRTSEDTEGFSSPTYIRHTPRITVTLSFWAEYSAINAPHRRALALTILRPLGRSYKLVLLLESRAKRAKALPLLRHKWSISICIFAKGLGIGIKPCKHISKY